MDAIFVITAALLNLLMLAINSGIAQESAENGTTMPAVALIQVGGVVWS